MVFRHSKHIDKTDQRSIQTQKQTRVLKTDIPRLEYILSSLFEAEGRLNIYEFGPYRKKKKHDSSILQTSTG